MEKRSEKSPGRRVPVCYVVLSVGLSLVLALFVAGLAIQDRERMAQLELRLEALALEAEEFRAQLQHCNNVTTQLLSEKQTSAESSTKVGQERYAYDDYYEDDSYDYDDDEDEDDEGAGTTGGGSNSRNRTGGGGGGKESRRHRRSSSGHHYNVLISQEPKPSPHLRPLEIHSRIFLEKNEAPLVQAPASVAKSDSQERRDHKIHRHQPATDHENRSRPKNRKKHRGWGDNVEVFAEGGHSAPFAVQYGGDTSRFKPSNPSHYDSNHRMYHPDGIFRDWSPSSWVGELEADTNFLFNKGVVTIDSPGLYFVYAQIFYADVHDTSGYRIYKNDVAQLQCTVSTLSQGVRVLKRNTCFTGGLLWLDSGDRLALKEVEGDRYTLFEPTKSFFGMFRVSSK